MKTLPQCTELTAARSVVVTSGRSRFNVKAGQSFWVTNTEVAQRNAGQYEIARKGAAMGSGFALDPEQFGAVFGVARPLTAGVDCLCNPAEIAAGRELPCIKCARR